MSRRSTATSTRHVDSSSPETVEARHTEDRLQHAHRDGGFLVLTVKPSYLRPCERNLLHRFPDLERISFDNLKRTFATDQRNTRFLGDLYQELSVVAQKKYALKQTPVFVEEFILDRTLTPALDEFGLH